MALQTKTYSIGNLAWASWSNAYLLELVLTEESVDVLTNTSKVTYKLQFRSGKQNRFAEDVNSSLSLDGAEVASDRAYKYLDFNSVWVLLSGEISVPHSSDGTKTLAFSGTAKPDAGNKWAPPEMLVEGEMKLTDIPRASTISAVSGNIGDRISVAITKYSPYYTHSIGFRFGKLSGYLNREGQISQSKVRFADNLVLFQLPESFFLQIPDAPSGVCELTCTTYMGREAIGEPQTTQFTAYVDGSRYGPEIYGTVKEGRRVVESMTGGNYLVPGVSEALCSALTGVQYDAQIKELTVNGKKMEDVFLTLPVTDGKYRFRVVDSRGFWAEKLVKVPIVPYIPLSLQASARRPGPTENTAILEISGKWYGGSFGLNDNQLTLTYKKSGGTPVTLQPQVTTDSFSASVTIPELDYRSTHTLVVEASDQFATRKVTVTVNRGVPVFDWGAEDFVFHVPVTAPELNCPQLTAILARLEALEKKN